MALVFPVTIDIGVDTPVITYGNLYWQSGPEDDFTLGFETCFNIKDIYDTYILLNSDNSLTLNSL